MKTREIINEVIKKNDKLNSFDNIKILLHFLLTKITIEMGSIIVTIIIAAIIINCYPFSGDC